MTTDTTRPRSRRRGRGHGAVLFAGIVLAAVAAAAAAGAAVGEDPPTEVEAQLEAEIDGMVESGVPEDDPKVEMLEEEAEAVEDGTGEPARRESGVDTGALLDEAAEQKAADAAAGDRVAAGDSGWESGTVVCEPVPGLLSVEEIAGATCVSVPQPDGTSRYVAVAPDGTMRTVLFGADGDVRRVDDTTLSAPPPPDAAFAPTPEGDLRVAPPGEPPATVEVP